MSQKASRLTNGAAFIVNEYLDGVKTGCAELFVNGKLVTYQDRQTLIGIVRAADFVVVRVVGAIGFKKVAANRFEWVTTLIDCEAKLRHESCLAYEERVANERKNENS